MRAKHLKIEEDSQLLALIRVKVNEGLDLHPKVIRSKMLLKLVFYASISMFFYFNLFFIQNTILFVASYIAAGMMLLLFAFNFAHDFSHNTIFKDKRWNNMGFIFIYSLVGAHAESWRDRHVNSHHFAPNVKEYDTDLQITSLIRVTPDMDYKWFHRFQVWYAPLAYMTYSLYWIIIKDFSLLIKRRKEGRARIRYILSFLIQKVFYFTLLLALPLLYSSQALWIVILGFLAMHLFQSIFLLFTFFMTHHVMETQYPKTDEDGIIQSSWLMNQIKSSNDMHPFSETANFFLGGFNNHIAHHLFPHIHHIHYPKLNEILYNVLINNGIQPNQTSYIGGVFSHMKLLKKLSVAP